MSKYKVNDHSILNVRSEEAKQGASWHDIAKRRAFSQHGEGELDPNDIHAVRKHEDPHLAHSSPQETEEALGPLEEQIKKLQMAEQEKTQLRQQAEQHRAQQYQAQQQHSQQNQQQDPHAAAKDDTYDEWFKD